MNRRKFTQFLGWGSLGLYISPQIACTQQIKEKLRISGIAPSALDDLVLHPELSYQRLFSWGDELFPGLSFGFNNDFLQFIPGSEPNEAQLWVNHEYIDPFFTSQSNPEAKTKAEVLAEMKLVGGSIWNIVFQNGQWILDETKPGFQLHANIPIPFARGVEIKGSAEAIGTLANCSGGLTPWGTILTCEENYDAFWGVSESPEDKPTPGYYGWENHFQRPSEHYGWVVEFDPKTNTAKKHTTLGRCAHECAHVVPLADERVVVYSGDDTSFQCLYKFVGDTPNSLETGELFVANVEKGQWISLDYNKQPALQARFKNQTEVLTYLRLAADLVGGSKLDRPEDIERDPNTGNILVALTNNSANDNPFGSILKIEEKEGYDGTSFEAGTFLAGGPETGFACPDNMAFDPAGNLWFTSDISGYKTHKPPYTEFGNNGLFLVPNTGPQQGEVIQIASAPINAELTGPCFSPDGKYLFLSVQHPGEGSNDHSNYLSNWPHGNQEMPRPSVVVIQGDLLRKWSVLQ